MSSAPTLAPLLVAATVAAALSRWASAHRPPVIGSLVAPAPGSVHRRPPPVVLDPRVQAVVWALVGVWAVGPVLVTGVGGLVLIGLRARSRRAARRALARRDAAVPDLVDLFVVASAAGHTAHGCIHAVSPRAPEVVQPVMVRASRRLHGGDPVSEVLAEASAELGPLGGPLTGALASGAATGAPMAGSLSQVAEAAREVRRSRAEEQARRLPVTQLFPLVLCILPAFLLLAVVPLLVGSLGLLQP